MDSGLKIKDGVVIPWSEIEITASKAGGPGGQHVNKTSSRITVRWNILTTNVLLPMQKSRALQKLAENLTNDGELIVHNSTSRSQPQNKVAALERLAELVRKALYIPKKRMQTKIPKAAKEARLQSKSYHSTIKKLRNKKINND